MSIPPLIGWNQSMALDSRKQPFNSRTKTSPNGTQRSLMGTTNAPNLLLLTANQDLRSYGFDWPTKY